MFVMRVARAALVKERPAYFDPRYQAHLKNVLPGEYVVTDEDLILSTLLGSCVSACVRDPVLKVGGMNHFMLPDRDKTAAESARYGGYAMEMLINELLKRGGRRERLEAKVFGGGEMMPGFAGSKIGVRNGKFVVEYLQREGIQLLAQDLGDVTPRMVHYFPRTGRAMVRRLPAVGDPALVEAESRYFRKLREAPAAGSVEIFSASQFEPEDDVT